MLLFRYSVVSGSLWPCGQQHTRLPCPSQSPRACSTSYLLSRWCHPTTSSSVIPFSCLQSFPASGFFPVNQSFTSRGRSIGASASSSVPPINLQSWSPLELTGLISLLSRGLSRVFYSTAPQFESIDSLAFSLLYGPTLISMHDCWKKCSFDYTNLCILCRQRNVSAF